MNYVEALDIAEHAKHVLAPYCRRLEIGGSIRRQKPECGDVEIVCIPRKTAAGLFGDRLEVDPGFIEAVECWKKIKGSPSGRYTQRVLPGGMLLDLFMADAANFGSLLVIRTGDWEFSKYVMGTLLPRHGYAAKDGYVYHNGVVVPMLEELDLFDRVGLPWIPPEQRTLQTVVAMTP